MKSSRPLAGWGIGWEALDMAERSGSNESLVGAEDSLGLSAAKLGKAILPLVATRWSTTTRCGRLSIKSGHDPAGTLARPTWDSPSGVRVGSGCPAQFMRSKIHPLGSTGPLASAGGQVPRRRSVFPPRNRAPPATEPRRFLIRRDRGGCDWPWRPDRTAAASRAFRSEPRLDGQLMRNFCQEPEEIRVESKVRGENTLGLKP